MMGNNLLSLSQKATLLEKVASTYTGYVDSGVAHCPNKQTFKISALGENLRIEREARMAAMNNFVMVKNAIDTRHINQEDARNPRTNLQYWHRTDQFIDGKDEHTLALFAKLMNVVNDIKIEYRE